jgi:hypothetical protein
LLQALYEVAVTHYLDLVGTHQKHLLAIHHDAQVGTQLPVKVGSLVPHDDLMIFKTHDDIIMLYRKFTNRKWTAADDRAGAKVNLSGLEGRSFLGRLVCHHDSRL